MTKFLHCQCWWYVVLFWTVLLCTTVQGNKQKEIKFSGQPATVYDDQNGFAIRLSGMVGNFQALLGLRPANEDRMWVQGEDFTIQEVLRDNDPKDSDEPITIDDGMIFIYRGPNKDRWIDTDSVDGDSLPIKLYLFTVAEENNATINYMKHPYIVANIYRKLRVVSSPAAIYYQEQTQTITLNTENAKGLTYLDLRFEDEIFLGRDFYFHSTFPLASNDVVLHLLPGRKWRSVPGIFRLAAIDTGGGIFGVNVDLGFVEDRQHTGKEYQEFALTGDLQSIFLPHNLKAMTVEVAGAAGGSMIANEPSSCGAIVKTIIPVDKLALDNDLFFLVGGMGQSGMEGGRGGFNGGGGVYDVTHQTCNYTEGKIIAGGGGGSSDIRLIRNGIATRLVVAGGGGGGVISTKRREKFTFHGGQGGFGGAVSGGDGTSGDSSDTTSFGHGGNQKEGGAGGSISACHDDSTPHGAGVDGRYWKGGDSHECSAGGGGSGYLSGGSGSCSGGGGGGSSIVTRSPADKTIIEEGKNCGNGYIKLWTEYYDFPLDPNVVDNDRDSKSNDEEEISASETFKLSKSFLYIVVAVVLLVSVIMVGCFISRFMFDKGGKGSRKRGSAYEMVPLDDDNLDEDEIAFMEGGPRRR